VQEAERLTALTSGGGCACKLGSVELERILSHLPKSSADPALLVGLDAPDDAAVYRVAPNVAIVQTVDFFTPIVDDARAWGRIAAVNALSDVYAMGGDPVIALNVVAWPRDLSDDLLARVLQGAGEACAEAGVTMAGGHSIDDVEPKFGLAVTGTVHPEAIVRKTGAPPGSDLVLTKPLGVGIACGGHKLGRTSAATTARAIEVMSELNAAAAAAMRAVGVSAATDVTGFGLMGHLLQMLGGTASAELSWGAMPVLADVVALAAEGVLPGGSKRNQDAYGPRVDVTALAPSEAAVLFDAQTSGGLLMAVTPERTPALLAELERRGVRTRAVIGRVLEGDGTVRVRR
jgi:selenide,water dikinase